jgi:hypothetical protein
MRQRPKSQGCVLSFPVDRALLLPPPADVTVLAAELRRVSYKVVKLAP